MGVVEMAEILQGVKCFLTGVEVKMETDFIRTTIELIEEKRIDPRMFGFLASESVRKLLETVEETVSPVCGVDREFVDFTVALKKAVEDSDIGRAKENLDRMDQLLWAREFEVKLKR